MTAVYPCDDRLYLDGVRTLYCETSPQYEEALSHKYGGDSKGKSKKAPEVNIINVKMDPLQSSDENPIECAGTLVRKPCVARSEESIRSRHPVPAGVDCTQRSVEYRAPRSSSKKQCVTWIKCNECLQLDNDYIAEMKAKQTALDAGIDDSELNRSVVQLLESSKRKLDKEDGDASSKKRPRQWKEEVAAFGKAELEDETITVQDMATMLSLHSWFSAVGEKLKVDDVKELVRANHIPLGSTKIEQLKHLAKVRHHGSPGMCQKCKTSYLEYRYDRESLLALPTSVKCRHNICNFEMKFKANYFEKPRPFCAPLCDTPTELLQKAGIETGSLIFDVPKVQSKKSTGRKKKKT